MSKTEEFNEYGTPHHAPEVDTPLSLSSQTNTTLKKARAWKSVGGVISAQNFGTVQSFDDKEPLQLPTSDKGASF